MFNFLNKLSIADYIQISIFITLFWYSWETRQLRKWQKKQAQLTILGLDMQRVKTHSEGRINPAPYGEKFPIIIRKIYELGEFDPKIMYSPMFHQPLNIYQKSVIKIKALLKK